MRWIANLPRQALLLLGVLACVVWSPIAAGESQPPGEAPENPPGNAAILQFGLPFAPASIIDRLDNVALTKHLTKIWNDQRQEVRSAKIRLRLLSCADWSDKDPLQQGHGLIPRTREEVNALLERIDLASEPDRLRELRDALLSGSLVRDQPFFHPITIAMDGRKLRIDWEDGESRVFDGENCIWLEPSKRQATVFNRWPPEHHLPTGLLHRHMIPGHVLESLRTIPFLSKSLTPAIDRRDALVTLQYGWDGGAYTQEIITDGEATVYRATSRLDKARRLPSQPDSQSVSQETFQYGHRFYPGNIVFPSVRIGTWYPLADKMQMITVSIIEEAQFNKPLPSETFQAAVPENTAVWDKRKGLKLRAAEEPVGDVLTLFEN